MRNVFIIHGSYGSPQGNWFPWLKKELSKLGHRVLVPQFPIPPVDKQDSSYSGHKLSEWIATLDDYKKYIDGDTIFIAHSRGCIFTYHYLAKIKPSISATFLVAPWINFLWYPKNNKKVDSFHKVQFDWKQIKKGSRYFEIYQSTNDDTPVSEGKEIAKNLNAKLIIVKNAGHFNVASSKKFVEFSLLLKNVEGFIKNSS
jgi:predicted alpha/beta hydrolase family esterase